MGKAEFALKSTSVVATFALTIVHSNKLGLPASHIRLAVFINKYTLKKSRFHWTDTTGLSGGIIEE